MAIRQVLKDWISSKASGIPFTSLLAFDLAAAATAWVIASVVVETLCELPGCF